MLRAMQIRMVFGSFETFGWVLADGSQRPFGMKPCHVVFEKDFLILTQATLA